MSMDIIEVVFNPSSKRLPTIKEVQSKILLDREKFDQYNFEKSAASMEIRDQYTKFLFPLITDDFFKSLKQMINDLKIKNIVELHCGTGWFSYWLNKYNIPISFSIDNKTWEPFKSNYLNFVKKRDSIKFVKNNPQIEIFILSWPYMDTTAYEIWQAMLPGQYLLYIGESYGGCTANDAFFIETSKFKVKDEWELAKNFISFWGVHDCPILFKKEK